MNNVKSKDILPRVFAALKGGEFSPIAVFLSEHRSHRGNLECCFANTFHTQERIRNNDSLLVEVFSEGSLSQQEAGDLLRHAEV